jgi:hypothetical protein
MGNLRAVLHNEELHHVFGSYMLDKGNHKFVQNDDRETTWKQFFVILRRWLGNIEIDFKDRPTDYVNEN